MSSRRLAAAVLGAALALAASAVAGPASADSNGPIGGPLLGRSGVIVDTSGGASAPPNVPAQAWLVADLDTGSVLAAKNPHERLRPASTLKTLTAVTLLPKLDKSMVYTATYDDAAVIGSKVGIVQGAPYTVDQLFYGMFLDSGNDASDALARAAGGISQTVAAMNAEARTLQALDTHATTPDGLDANGQLTSAYDLALISRAGLARSDFRHYVATRSYAFPGKPAAPGTPRPTFMIYNQNRLLGSFPGAIGVKTGYTTLAHFTFVGAATRSGHTLIATVMDTGPAYQKEAAALLDWGFANLAKAIPVGLLVDPLPTGPAGSAAEPTAAGAPTDVAAPVEHSATTVAARSHPDRLLRELGMAGAGLVLLAGLVVLRGEQVKRRRAARRRRGLGAGMASAATSLRQRPPAPGRSLALGPPGRASAGRLGGGVGAGPVRTLPARLAEGLRGGLGRLRPPITPAPVVDGMPGPASGDAQGAWGVAAGSRGVRVSWPRVEGAEHGPQATLGTKPKVERGIEPEPEAEPEPEPEAEPDSADQEHRQPGQESVPTVPRGGGHVVVRRESDSVRLDRDLAREP